MLKFLVYLDAVGEADGAFRCVPGSHRLSRRVRRFHRRRGVRVVDLPNRELRPGLAPPLTIPDDAGCLVVFSTDLYHHGGRVEPGHERRVMRSHTNRRPRLRYDAPWPGMPQWWAETRRNPLPRRLRAADRITGARPPDTGPSEETGR